MQKALDIFTKAEVDALCERSNWQAALLILHCWGTILLTWAICVIWTNPFTILLGILVIGARQLGLFVIAHDAAHFLLFKSRKTNDWAAEWLLQRPVLGASIVPYRNYHLTHHRYTQQENDPDLPLSAPFPITKQSFRRKMIRDITGRTGWGQHTDTIKRAFGTTDMSWTDRLRKGARRMGPNLLINLGFLAGFTYVGHWYLYFLLWIVPLFTWQLVITRIRNIAEHACVPDNNNSLKNTRTTYANPLMR
ncbi:MAG: fatty acid desaturase family protein, partial [Pseudomonadota bacterium]